MKGWCDGGHYGCDHAATFVARNENTAPAAMWEYGGEPRMLNATFEACGKHLAALIAAYPIPDSDSTRFIVVPCNPNVSRIETIKTEET